MITSADINSLSEQLSLLFSAFVRPLQAEQTALLSSRIWQCLFYEILATKKVFKSKVGLFKSQNVVLSFTGV